ncbi:divalent metal cation transporter [Candidatus Roizmanbacteria bacterium]|nr:divalent metal cation transporter [Candidatus Roizmanbacteria bacterium]
MKEFIKQARYRLMIFLAVFGPATITAVSDDDGAGVATYSLAGAKFGYSILFILFVVTFLLAITQEMGVRIALVTRKGLGDLIRERYGIILSVVVFFILFIANLGTIVSNFAALKATFQMFGLPVAPFLFLSVAFSIIIVSKGNYEVNQKIFLLAVVLYFSYVISAFKAKPDWSLAFKSLVVPTGIKLSKEFIFASIAVLGTTITPWGQFFVHSFVLDKKLSVDKLKFTQFETYFGALFTDFFSFFMIVATASTLFVHNIPLTSGEQAALAIKPFAGELAGFLFGFGIINAALMGIIIISLTTAYAFAEFFGYEGSLDAPFQKGRLFYGIFIFQVVAAALIVLLPFVSLFKIVFITQAMNGFLLPLIFFFLLKITNNKDLMGQHVNSKIYNYFAIISSVIIIISSLFVLISSFL